jgi:hypothetical protein
LLLGGKCGRPQPANDASLAGTRSLPAQADLLFTGFLKLLHATCDLVRVLRSLSEGSATPDRRWNDNGVSVASFQT